MKEKVLLDVKVKPGAARDQVLGFRDGVLTVAVEAKAEAGRANEALIRFLAKCLSLSPSAVRILRGKNQRRKLVEICGLSREKALAALLGPR